MSEIISVEAREITDYEEAFRTHQRIMANGTIAAQALFEVCKDLKHMRDEKLYAALGYENFEDYCEQMAGIKSRMAYNYITEVFPVLFCGRAPTARKRKILSHKMSWKHLKKSTA